MGWSRQNGALAATGKLRHIAKSIQAKTKILTAAAQADSSLGEAVEGEIVCRFLLFWRIMR